MRLAYGMMLLAMFGFTTVGMTGCSSNADTVSTEEHDDHDHEGEEHASHDHSGWWCNEHGVPEDECALCKTSLVAEFKAKGDWCEEHDRPDSHCFEWARPAASSTESRPSPSQTQAIPTFSPSLRNELIF